MPSKDDYRCNSYSEVNLIACMIANVDGLRKEICRMATSGGGQETDLNTQTKRGSANHEK